MGEGKISDAFLDVTTAMATIQPAIADCKVIAADLAKLRIATRGLSRERILENYATHKTEIQEAVGDASECREAGDWSGFGMHMGSALRLLIEVEVTTTTSTLPITATTLADVVV